MKITYEVWHDQKKHDLKTDGPYQPGDLRKYSAAIARIIPNAIVRVSGIEGVTR